MKTLIEVLQVADSIEISDNIDSYFFRHFNLNKKAENEDDIILHVRNVDDGFLCHDFFFTKQQLEGAIFRSEINKWTVRNEISNELYFIGAYFVRSISLK